MTSTRSVVWQLPPLSLGEVHSNFRLTEFRMSASTRFYSAEYKYRLLEEQH